MRQVDNTTNILTVFYSSVINKNGVGKNKSPEDTVQLSDTSKVFNKLDNFMNLGKRDRFNVSDLNDEEKKEFLKMLSELLKRGIVGYEVLEVNGKPEKHYIVNQIGDQRIYGAKLYKKNGNY